MDSNTVIYCRVSTNLQDTESQLSDLKKYADASGLNIIKTFGEKVSGYDQSKERKEYEAMKSFVISNEIKNILMWELSRLGRSTTQILIEIELFTSKGINIFFKKENLNTLSENSASKLLLNVLSSVAEMERTTIAERCIRGRIHSVEKGKRTGFGVMPYGYAANENKNIVVEPTEASVIQNIYKMGKKGLSLYDIAHILNSKNVPTRTELLGRSRVLNDGTEVKSLWRTVTLRKILKNPLYKGERHYSNIIVSVPAIIDESLWNSVQERFQEHIGYTNNTKYDYLLKSKIRCGKCKLAYLSRTDKTKYGGQSSYYFCSGRKDGGIKCRNGQMKSSVIDRFVFELMLQHSEIMIALLKERQSTFDVMERKKRINNYNQELGEYEKRRKRILGLYKDGHIDKEEFEKDMRQIKRSVNKLNGTIDQLRKELEAFNTLGTSIYSDHKRLKSESEFSIRREFVLKYLDRVEVFKVKSFDFDFTDHFIWETENGKPTRVNYKRPHGNDKIVYLEIYAFGTANPIKAVVTTVTENCLKSNDLEFKKGTLSLATSSKELTNIYGRRIIGG